VASLDGQLWGLKLPSKIKSRYHLTFRWRHPAKFGRRARGLHRSRGGHLLAEKAKALGRSALKKLDTIVTPDTLLRWHT